MSHDLKQRVEDRLDQGLLGLWYVIAKSSDIPADKPHAVKALGRNLVLWRNKAGKLSCVADQCPHRGAKLSMGIASDDVIACRYHGVEVNGAGVVTSVPAFPGCVLEGRKAVDSYEVIESNDAVFAYFASVDRPKPIPLTLPYELTTGEYATFLTTAPWGCNYRYAMENVADPMHGPWLHGDTFTLAGGVKHDEVELLNEPDGFVVARVAQQGENFDWAHIVTEAGALYMRVNIPYPKAGGPGGIMRVVTFVTPIDDKTSQIFFWRTRKVSGLAREAWRFMFRATFEERHWYVLEQDRVMLEGLAPDARDHELLYQHDAGITRMRQIMRRMAKAQLEAENANSTAAE